MKRTLQSLLLLVFTTLTLTCNVDSPYIRKYKTKHVIIVIVDGPRWTETWGMSNGQYIPHRYAMKNEGSFYSNFQNNGTTLTNPGHTAICTSNYENVDNSGADLPSKPGIFQYFLKSSGLPSSKAWVIASKDKLYILGDCTDSTWNGHYNPSLDVGVAGPNSGYRTDDITYHNAFQILSTQKPDLALIQFKEPDASGHANDWASYLLGITQTDKYVYNIWKFIQSNPYYAGSTTLIVTNDHGRHIDGYKDGFISHGDYCSGCKHIEFFAMGPDFKPGTYTTYRSQVDIAPTVAKLLGFSMPTAKGYAMNELFW